MIKIGTHHLYTTLYGICVQFFDILSLSKKKKTPKSTGPPKIPKILKFVIFQGIFKIFGILGGPVDFGVFF